MAALKFIWDFLVFFGGWFWHNDEETVDECKLINAK